jgi:hypothetical protein
VPLWEIGQVVICFHDSISYRHIEKHDTNWNLLLPLWTIYRQEDEVNNINFLIFNLVTCSMKHTPSVHLLLTLGH